MSHLVSESQVVSVPPVIVAGWTTRDGCTGGLTHQGFDLGAHAPKAVSDALRWEIGWGRVVRVRRGTYDATVWPRSTAHRIFKRVLALRSRARELRPVDLDAYDDAFWESLG